MTSVAGEPDGSRPLRKDAQRTRRLVLDAAKELFAERGVEVAFDEIARKAGVGIGTVYRRFPDRQSLVEALFLEKARDIVAIAESARAVEDPWEAVVQFCEHTVEEMQADRGLAQVLTGGAVAHDRFELLREKVASTVDELVQRAHEAGVVRVDLHGPDLALVSHLISRVALDDGGQLWRRYLTLFLDAARARPDNTTLPEPIPTIAMFEEVTQRL